MRRKLFDNELLSDCQMVLSQMVYDAHQPPVKKQAVEVPSYIKHKRYINMFQLY